MSESRDVRFPFMNLINPTVWEELVTVKKYLPLLLDGMDLMAFEADWYRQNGQVNNQRMVEFRERVQILDDHNPIDFYSITVPELISRLLVRRRSAVSEEQYVNDLYNEIIDLAPLEMDPRLLEDVLSDEFAECNSWKYLDHSRMRKLLQFLNLRYDRPGSLLSVLKNTLEQGSYSSSAVKATGRRPLSPEYFEYMAELFKIESETVVEDGVEFLKEAPSLQRETFLSHSNWADGVSMSRAVETLAKFGKLFAAPKPKYITGIDARGNTYAFEAESPEDPRCVPNKEYRDLTGWLKPGNEHATKLVTQLLQGTPAGQIVIGALASEIEFSWLKVIELAEDYGCSSYDDWVKFLGRAEEYFTYHLQDNRGFMNLCQAVAREACKDKRNGANAIAAVQHHMSAKYNHFLTVRAPYEMFDAGDVPLNGPALLMAYLPHWEVVKKLAPNYKKFSYAYQDDFLRKLFNDPVANMWRITNGDTVYLDSRDTWAALDYLKVDQEKWHQKTVDFWFVLLDLMLAEQQKDDHKNFHMGNLIATAEAAVQ